MKKFLFSMMHSGYLRNFRSTLEALLERGASVHICFHRKDTMGGDVLLAEIVTKYPSLTFSMVPLKGSFPWGKFSKVVRLTIDYLRYFHEDYKSVTKLKKRVYDKAPTVFRLMSWFPFLQFPWVSRFLNYYLCVLESVIPVDPVVTESMSQFEPDGVILTPLVEIASPQVDYVKAARRQGIPSCLLVHSWDNLTNKGLMKSVPDRVAVWNELQKKEAIRYHGVHQESVWVTGSPAYDHWFDWTPSRDRPSFLKEVGLLPSQSYILYLCSSPFIAPTETEFIKNWIRKLRHSDNCFGKIGILIRPHPQNYKQWLNVDLEGLGNVAVWPGKPENPIDLQSRQNYYDSIFYSALVMGINTSGLIETTIVGKSVYTFLTPEFKGTQTETMHFHLLLNSNGGPLHVSDRWDEHVEQLKEGLLNPLVPAHQKRSSFVETFVRPLGREKPVSPIIAELLLSPDFKCERPADVGVFPQFCATTVILLFSPLPNVLDQMKRYFPRLSHPLQRVSAGGKRFLKNIFRWPFQVLQGNRFGRKVLIPWMVKELTGAPPLNGEIAEILAQIKSVARGKSPILVGPWLSEVGFEILYWIPFLNWVQERFQIDPNRFIIVSRGGAGVWYKNLSSRYFDIFDLFSSEEFRKQNDLRVHSHGGQKQVEISTFDLMIVHRMRDSKMLKKFNWLHPSLMYNLFKFFWRREASIGLIDRYTRFTPFSFKDPLALDLPQKYTAVKFYFSAAFPMTKENGDFVLEFVKRLAQIGPVVVLSTGLKLDDHQESQLEEFGDQIRSYAHLMTPSTNLRIQTEIIARAERFYGTYGGFSYLAPFCNVPSVAFYSHENNFLQVHLDVAVRAARAVKGLGFIAPKLSRKPSGILPAQGDGSPVSTLTGVQGGRGDFVPLKTTDLDFFRGIV